MERDQSSTVATSNAWKLPAGIAGAILLLFVIVGIAMLVKKKRSGGKEKVSSYAHSELDSELNINKLDSEEKNGVIIKDSTASNAGIPDSNSSLKPNSNHEYDSSTANSYSGGAGSNTLQDKLNGNSVIPKA